MSRRPDWWLRRYNETVGGSRAPKVIGVSRFGNPATEFDYATGAQKASVPVDTTLVLF